MFISQISQEPPKPLSVRANSLANAFGCLFYQGCQWVITVLVVILSDYDSAGVLAYAMAIGNIFLPIASYNLRTYQISDLSGTYSDGEYLAFRFVTVAAAFAVVIPYAGMTTADSSFLVPVAVYMLFKMDEAVVDVFSGMHQKGQRMDYIGISQFLRGVLSVAAFSLGLVLAGDISIAFMLMFLACAGITVWFDLPHARRFTSIDVSIRWGRCKALFRTGLPLMVSSFMSSMVVSYARQTYGNMAGPELLGIYASVATPSILIQAAARYLYGPCLVPLAQSLADGGTSRFAKTMVPVTLLLALGSCMLGAMLVIFGPSLLELLYGQEIGAYTFLLVGMVVATVLNTFQLFFSDVLVICRDLNATFFVSLAALVPSLLLSAPLEGEFGMQGINATIIAAYSLSLCIAVARLLSFFWRERARE